MKLNLELKHDGFEKWLVAKEYRLGGVHYVFHFDNNRGASIVKFVGTMGHVADLWELGVIYFGETDEDYLLDYNTPIADDVIGNLTDKEVCELLAQIRDLPVGFMVAPDSH